MTRPGIRGWLPAALLCLAAVPARAEDVLIFEVNGVDGLTPGEIVPAGGTVEVPVGGELVIINGAGEVVSFVGPYSGTLDTAPAASAEDDLLQVLGGLIEPATSSEAGAIRGLPLQLRPEEPGPWVVDTTLSGAACVPGNTPVRLWRPAPAAAAPVTIAPSAGGDSFSAEWPAGVDTVWWPDSLPLADGARYAIDFPTLGVSTELTVHVPGESFDTPAQAAAWMVRQECRAQARRLLDRLEADRVVGP